MSEPTIQFVEACEPPIKTGRQYKIKVTQQVTELDATRAPKAGGVDKPYHHLRTVHVQGERFSIDPQDIVAVYPPDGSVGNYSRILPSITFSRKTLPWEQSSGLQKAPWLALLVFHERDRGGVPQPVPAMIGDLLRQPFSPGRSLPKRDSTLVAAERKNKSVIVTHADASPGWDVMPGEDRWHPCLIVDVPVAQFLALAPTKQDLPWLAHSRAVSEGSGPAATFSAVMANRVPQLGDNTAYLVSMAGLSNFLEPSPSLPAGATHVRLVVLKAWRFRHGEYPSGFDRPLSTDPLSVPYVDPVPPDNTAEGVTVKNALAMGYTALDHHTRWGDRTVSWYRGPLLPFSSQVTISVPLPPICEEGYVTGSAPLSSADEALRYDPELGMLDASYAAAWQLGRLLALRDKTFSYDMYAWKQEIRRKVFAAGAAAERAVYHGQLAPRRADPVAAQAGPVPPSDNGAGEFFALLAGLIKPALDALASAEGPTASAPDPFGGDGAEAPVRRMNPKTWAQSLFQDRDKLKAHVDHAGIKAPPSVVRGLEKLRRLEGVPIDYLVPDERMLPTESLRFFQVDLNWVYSLVEGAYSVARVSAQDHSQDAATCPHDSFHQISGFLVRSSLISEWPGLQVLTEISSTAARYKTLRCERIAPDILLCLIEVEGPGVITSVTFQVPPEQIEFHLPKAAAFRDGLHSVVDVHALSQGTGTAADFAYKLTRPALSPTLQWDDERDIVVLAIEAMDDADRGEWQFMANGHPFGPPVSCRAATGKVEIALPDDLPAGEISVRLRPDAVGADVGRGRWVTSNALAREAAPSQPVLGYRVAEGCITAQWPADEAGPLETRLRHTSPSTGKSADVGKALKLSALGTTQPLRAIIDIGDKELAGQVQVRFRKASPSSNNLPGAWGTSTQVFRRARAPTRGVGQGESPSQLLFFDENYLDGFADDSAIELIISTDEFDMSRPVHAATGMGKRVYFDVRPEFLGAGYWAHARVVGKDDRVLSSCWFSVRLTGRSG